VKTFSAYSLDLEGLLSQSSEDCFGSKAPLRIFEKQSLELTVQGV